MSPKEQLTISRVNSVMTTPCQPFFGHQHNPGYHDRLEKSTEGSRSVARPTNALLVDMEVVQLSFLGVCSAEFFPKRNLAGTYVFSRCIGERHTQSHSWGLTADEDQ